MGTLTNLLKWKKVVTLVDANEKPLLNENKKPIQVYMRIVGDKSLNEAYATAREFSADKRRALRDKNSADFKSDVLIFENASRDECFEAIRLSNATGWTNQAMSEVKRPDEITIEEVASDPDAATLEEQEKCDALNKEANEKYLEDIQEYVRQQSITLESELQSMDDEALRKIAMSAQETILPLAVFIERLQIEKTWRACYDDSAYSVPSFSNVEEFLESSGPIKNQLLSAYTQLEIKGEVSKN